MQARYCRNCAREKHLADMRRGKNYVQSGRESMASDVITSGEKAVVSYSITLERSSEQCRGMVPKRMLDIKITSRPKRRAAKTTRAEYAIADLRERLGADWTVEFDSIPAEKPGNVRLTMKKTRGMFVFDLNLEVEKE